MYYEVYIDVVFVTNLLMDYILLRLVGRLMHFGCTRRRCALGAFLGAVFSSLMLFVRMDVVPVRIMLHGGCGVMMAVFTFRLKKGSLLMKALAAMYMTAFLMGGLWEMAAGRGKFTWLTFCILGVGSFGLMDVAVYLGDLFRVHRKNIYPVTLSYGKNIQTLYGFYDTGNLLTDPGTGKPVSLVKAEYIKEILSEDTVERLKYIKENPGELKGTELTGLHPHFLTCKNAGGKESLLLAVTLEELCIHTPGEVVHVGKPVIAMLFEPSALGEEYEVLLNSGLLY